ncbi:DUF4158 domain-containing protein [Nonomuraea jabiensis]|uniref:DUF4158 domain-containing protein n=1 Tax=Nonomuraea jabiensis TaxID=882448 RepID=UPI00161C439A
MNYRHAVGDAWRLSPVRRKVFVHRPGNIPKGIPTQGCRSELAFYKWSESTIAYHRSQIRAHLGFRSCTTADAGKAGVWLAGNIAHAERRPDRVREELLKHLREEPWSRLRRAGSPGSWPRHCIRPR